MPGGAATFEITAESGTPDVPFSEINHHVILPVSVNGSEPLRVVLDTGMPMSGLVLYGGERADSLDLDFAEGMGVAVGGAGGHGERMTARMALDQRVELPGVTIDGMQIVVLPEFDHPVGYHDGIIGATLFERFVVELDNQRKRMRLHEPATYKAAEGARSVELEMRGNMPFVDAGVRIDAAGKSRPVHLVVDLGAGHALSLNTGSEGVTLPAASVETVLGRGLSGEIHGKVGRVAHFDLGGAILEQVLTSFPVEEHQNPRGMDSRDGNLGNGLLRRFNVTFDYSRRRMLLEDTPEMGEPFLFDGSGLRLESRNGALQVTGILAGSPAAEAGLREGDRLLSLDGESVAAGDLYDVREQLRRSGRQVSLTFGREEKRIPVKLELRELV
ncbi:hypothetical protein ABI59_00430 [Acidobacteria bacterium Mor1]|nr:hypothetical protein ABI59_00430 [Acidobacteria bacterium Mor1]